MNDESFDKSEFSASDREECGILVGHRENGVRFVDRIVKVENCAPNPADDYAISMSDFKKVEENLTDGEEAIGFFHTHLPHHPVNPSANDLEGAKLFPTLLNCIYKPDTKEMFWYSAVRKDGET